MSGASRVRYVEMAGYGFPPAVRLKHVVSSPRTQCSWGFLRVDNIYMANGSIVLSQVFHEETNDE